MTWYHSKRIFIWSVICIFITLLATVIEEYSSVSTRLDRMDYIIRTALDVAVEDSMQSEEAFTDDKNKMLISTAAYSPKTGGTRTATETAEAVNEKVEDILVDGRSQGSYLAHNTIDVFARGTDSNSSGAAGGSFVAINPYYLAISYAMNGNKPMINKDQIEQYKTFGIFNSNSNDATAGVFAFLYGQPSWGNYLSWSELTDDDVETLSDATNSSTVIKSGNTTVGEANTSTTNALSSSLRTLDDFSTFYDQIGSTVRTRNYTRVKQSDDENKVIVSEYPTLLNMGLHFNTSKSENNYGTGSTVTIEDKEQGESVGVASSVNLENSVKAGKHKDVNGMDWKSYYFLTPQSLGVTYVPLSVVKPVFTAELDSLMRYDLVASGKGANMNQATGCIDTSYYRDGTNASQAKHISTGELITNNGDFEVDLNSIKVKVDYFKVNIYSGNNALGDVMSVSMGGYTKGITRDLSFANAGVAEATHLLNSDTALASINSGLMHDEDSEDEDPANATNRLGQRLIARVTVKVKCHVPYKNSLMQWMCDKQPTTSTTKHYGIKLWDSNNNKLSQGNSDSIWYQTSKYVCVSR